ncbi:hypothetical protein P0Y67_11990 [Photobacterium sp. SP02]|uniref:hypothetical protein n=1 Tax=Photobacterium sp. SP02 TaxID=3032280 RepID=UPI003144EEF5
MMLRSTCHRIARTGGLCITGFLVFLLSSHPVFAAESGGLTLMTVSDGAANQEYSVKLQVLLLRTPLVQIFALLLQSL